MDTVHGLCRRLVDPDHVGTGVIGQAEGCMEESLRCHIVDERPVTQAQQACLVLRSAGSDATYIDWGRNLTGGQRLHRIQDLHVAGTPAEVPSQVAGCLVSR